MRNILFRADSSSTIGTGHIMRDLVLAKQFRDDHIIFATQDLPGNINYKIEEEGYQVGVLQSGELSELIDVVYKYDIEMIVIDHYGIDEHDEKALKKQTGIKLFVLDDTYEKHYCDILLNHNIYAKKVKYKNLVPQECELRCGGEYMLLRDEFILEKKRGPHPIKTNKIKIFIGVGGTDHANINPRILEALKSFEEVEVELVTTNANKHLKELQSYVESLNWVHLHVNSNSIAKIMNECDFAIVTPSVTMNEVYYLDLPFIAIKTAENQKYMYEYLEENQYLVLSSFHENGLQQCVQEMIKSIR